MVLSSNSPLTQFLESEFKPDPDQEAEEIHNLWMEVFDTDWPGDLSLLPSLSSRKKLRNADLARVKSRSMYERLCKLFPKAKEEKFAKFDKQIEKEIRSRKRAKHEPGKTSDETPLRLLHVPMRHMWLDLLANSIKKYPYARAQDCIFEGHTDFFRHLVKIGKVVLNRFMVVYLINHAKVHNVLNFVADRGHLDILKMFHVAGYGRFSPDVMAFAASRGHLDVVKWLLGNCKEGCSARVMDLAAGGGHLDVVKWLHENRKKGCTTEAMDGAASNGHLDVVKWLHENRNEGCTKNAMDGAAKNRHLDVVKFLHENRTEGCTTKAMNWAADAGHFDIVKWLHENRTEGCSTVVMDKAAHRGDLDLVKWLHEDGLQECTTKAIYWAACNGHLHVVKYLHEYRFEGCTKEALIGAARKGHLDVVRFLLEYRSEKVFDGAIEHCKTPQIAEMLVATLSVYQLRKTLEKALRHLWSGPGVAALKKAFDYQEE